MPKHILSVPKLFSRYCALLLLKFKCIEPGLILVIQVYVKQYKHYMYDLITTVMFLSLWISNKVSIQNEFKIELD